MLSTEKTNDDECDLKKQGKIIEMGARDRREREQKKTTYVHMNQFGQMNYST